MRIPPCRGQSIEMIDFRRIDRGGCGIVSHVTRFSKEERKVTQRCTADGRHSSIIEDLSLFLHIHLLVMVLRIIA